MKFIPEVFYKEAVLKLLHLAESFFKLESFRNFTEKIPHHKYFQNDFVKLFRTSLTSCIGSFATAKNDYVAYRTKTWQKNTQGANNLVLPSLTLNMTLPLNTAPKFLG